MNDKETFEALVARMNDRRYGVLCSRPIPSALIAAMSSRNGERELRRGQEVILSMIGTTLPHVLRAGLTPVFVDVDLGTYNANPCLVEEAVGSETGALLLPHVLGNPLAIKYLTDHIPEAGIWNIFEGGICGTCTGTYEGRPVGAFGDFSIFSLRGAGGVVLVDSPHLQEILCGACKCGVETPNTDILKQMPSTVSQQRRNWKFYYDAFKNDGLDKFFVLPEAHRMADPAWTGFALTCREGVDRTPLLSFMKHYGLRYHLFQIQEYRQYKQVGASRNAEIVEKRSFWLETSPEATASLSSIALTINHYAKRL